MSDKKTQLVQFMKETKWEDYIGDSSVLDTIEKLQTKVNQLSKSHTASSEKISDDLSNITRIKLVVVGDGAVGKTSLLMRFSTGQFPTDYVPTVFENSTVQITYKNEQILLNFWDTAGQEEYDRLRPLSYPRSDIILLCFSTISQVSFESIKQKWWPEVHHYIPDVPYILVGTKIDLRESKALDPHTNKFNPVSFEQGNAVAKEIGCVKYLEICSKDGRGTQEVLDESIKQVFIQRGVKVEAGNSDTSESRGKKDDQASTE